MTRRICLPTDPGAAWTAEIEWCEGRFRAVARPSDGGPAERLAESAKLTWPPSGHAEVEAMKEAQRDLEAALARGGWKPLVGDGPWYAARFAWEPAASGSATAEEAESGPRLFAPIPAWPAEAKQHWRCEISWDAGWMRSRFRAVGYRPHRRHGRVFGASGPVRGQAMAQPDPARYEHRVALGVLESALETAGWERMDGSADWYATRYWWPREGAPAERLELAAPHPEAGP